MDLLEITGYSLLLVSALELLMGTALLRGKPRKNPVRRSIAVFSFFAAGFALATAIAYLRSHHGLDPSFSTRLTWIGWFMLPAALQFVYYQKDETGRSARIAGAILYPFWAIVFLLCLFTDLVEPGDASLVPFIDRSGPLEHPIRAAGLIMILWIMIEISRLRKSVTGIKRTRYDYFFYGNLIFIGGGALLVGLLPLFSGIRLDPALASYFTLPWVAVTSYAVTRDRLFDFRQVMFHAAVLMLLSGLVVGAHLALFQLFEPSLGGRAAIFVSISLIGFAVFGIQFNRGLRAWLERTLTQRRYDYQKVLRNSTRALSTILDLDELLAFIITNVRQSLSVESICLYLRTVDGRYTLRHGYDVHARIAQNWALSDDLVRRLKKTGRIMIREELGSEDRGGEAAFITAYLRDFDAAAVIPLIHKDELLGVLTLGQKRGIESYTPDDIDLLEALAGHVAMAIENALLYEKMEEKVRERTRELEEARSIAEAANKAKSEFLSNISHELRTPLNAIIGFSAVMKDGDAGPLSPDQQAYAKDIWESGKHLLRIINNLLDLSKIEAGMMDLEFDEFYLKELLEGSLSLFRERAQRRRITLGAAIDDIGPVVADKTKIKQVALNLLANAVKFTPDGGSVRITAKRVDRKPFKVRKKSISNAELGTLDHEPDGDFIEISVEDTGIGMSAEDCGKLFRPFLQLDNTLTKKYEGTGLGLHLSKKIIELHGGSVRVESEAGKGSTFSFTIPRNAREQGARMADRGTSEGGGQS